MALRTPIKICHKDLINQHSVRDITAEIYLPQSCESWTMEGKMTACFHLIFFHTTFTICVRRQSPVKTPTIYTRCTWLRTNSLVDFLRFTLGQKDLVVAQPLNIDQRLQSVREVHRSSARAHDDNGDPIRTYSDVSRVRVTSLSAKLVYSNSTVPKAPKRV